MMYLSPQLSTLKDGEDTDSDRTQLALLSLAKTNKSKQSTKIGLLFFYRLSIPSLASQLLTFKLNLSLDLRLASESAIPIVTDFDDFCDLLPGVFLAKFLPSTTDLFVPSVCALMLYATRLWYNITLDTYKHERKLKASKHRDFTCDCTYIQVSAQHTPFSIMDLVQRAN